MITLANGLAEAGYDVDLVVLRATGQFERYVSGRLRCVELDAPTRGLATALAVPKLAGYLLRRRPDRLVTTLESLNLVAFVAATIVGRRRDISIRLTTTYEREPRPFLRRLSVRWAYRLHKGVFVANSQGSAESFGRHFPSQTSRLHVVYNCVELEVIAEQSREGLHLGEIDLTNRRYLAFVGRFAPAKRVDVLLHAFAEVATRHPVDLLLLGEGPLENEVRSLVAELQLERRVHLLGFQPNPYPYMARAEALVLSSDYEGMPTVLIEALACGCQVAATDCPSGPGEVLDGGRFGKLAAVGDPGALADAIERALQNPVPPERLRERAKLFSKERAAASYAGLLFGEQGEAPSPDRATSSLLPTT